MNLTDFKGKVCSIFTVPIQRKMKNTEEEFQYFVGVVEDITSHGIFITQISTGLKSYFSLNNIVGICEEEVLDPKNPNDSKIIKEISPEAEFIQEKTIVDDEEKIDINSLTNLINNVKTQSKNS